MRVTSITLYFESVLLYFATILASGCIENEYSKGKEKVGKEKVVTSVQFINANLLAVGDANTLIFFLLHLYSFTFITLPDNCHFGTYKASIVHVSSSVYLLIS